MDQGPKAVRKAAIGGMLLLVAVGGIVGCGGSSATTSGLAVERARKEGETAAHEKDRVAALQHRVERLEKQSGSAAAKSGPAPARPAAPVPSDEQAPSASTAPNPPGVTFHTPSGNVACEVDGSGAICSVGSLEETFAMSSGGPGRIESGISVPMESGELADYGATIAVGTVSCLVPPSNVPRGVTCADSSSGHGFEASRIAARANAY